MNILTVILALSLVTLAGLGFGEGLHLYKGKSMLEKLSLSFGVGAGLVGIIMFVITLVGVAWNFYTIAFPLFAISLLYVVRSSKIGKVGLSIKKLSFFQAILLLLILITSFYVVWGSTLRPLPSWDGWASFYLHGKAYYLDGFLNPEVARYSGVSSPPIVPLLIASIYFVIGEVDDRFSLLLFSTFYLALGLLFFENIRKRLSLSYSLLFTFLLLSIPNLMRHAGGVDVGHADIIVGFYFFASVLSMLDYAKERSYSKLILSQMLLAIGALVKDEGLVFFLLGQLFLIYLIVKKRRLSKLYFLMIGFSIVAGWWMFKAIYHIPQNPFVENIPNFTRVLPIAYGAIFEFLNITRWNLIWPIGLLVFVIARKTYEARIVSLFIAMQLVVYFYTYLTTPIDPIGHMAGSFDRLLLHLLPLLVFLTALSSANIKK